jgi:uncharacterized protein
MAIVDFQTHLAERWFEQPLMSEEEFVAGLDRVGIGVACVFTLMGFYEDCPAHNDRLAAAARRHPGRLIPFVTVDPKLGPPALRELERCLGDPIFRGVKFHPWCQAFACSMVRGTMTEILGLAAQRGVPVLFHDGTPPYATTFQVAAAARWVPEATIVLGHAGLADYGVAAAQLVRDIPNLYANFCGPKAGDLLHLLDIAGPAKIVWGSDYGAADWRILAERLDDVLCADLDATTQEQILYANAARLLRLDEPTGAGDCGITR